MNCSKSLIGAAGAYALVAVIQRQDCSMFFSDGRYSGHHFITFKALGPLQLVSALN